MSHVLMCVSLRKREAEFYRDEHGNRLTEARPRTEAPFFRGLHRFSVKTKPLVERPHDLNASADACRLNDTLDPHLPLDLCAHGF